MLMPRRQKYRKVFRGRMRGQARGGTTVAFGDWGIQALEPAWIDSRQIEAARRSITNYVRRGGKVWIRIFPDKPVTQKPAETRMGKGKGNPEYFVAVVRPGRVMFELGGVRDDLAVEALTRAAHKLPIKCRIIPRESFGSAVAEEAAVEAGD
jgi:large subunit ribosomal protein L16